MEDELNDLQAFNDPKYFYFDGQNTNAPWETNVPFGSFNKIILGGSDVMIHRMSIWKTALTLTESELLFDGDILASDALHATATWDPQNIEWINPTELPLDSLVSVLHPDNAGRMVDHIAEGHIVKSSGTDDPYTDPDPDIRIFQGAFLTMGGLTIDGDNLSFENDYGHTGAVTPNLPTVNRKSVRRSPDGTCDLGCNRNSRACNFNPFANQFGDCELECGTSGETIAVTAFPTMMDEFRMWESAPFDAYNQPGRTLDYAPWQAANHWKSRYPETYTTGLLMMHPADESLGSILYDRSKYGDDAESWMGHNARLYHQQVQYNDLGQVLSSISSDVTRDYYSDDLPGSLGNWTFSGTNAGEYVIGNVRYTGSGFFYDITPTKSTSGFTHTFAPAQRTTFIGDALLVSENQDFVDKSGFEVEVDVRYFNIIAGQNAGGTIDYNYTDSGDASQFTASDCPVRGVSFKVGEGETQEILMGGDNNPIKTDSLGRATLILPRGYHRITPFLDPNEEAVEGDEHEFASGTTGQVIYVEGPMGRDIDGNVATEAQKFIDITTRRAVGRVLGGTNEVVLPWDSSLSVPSRY